MYIAQAYKGLHEWWRYLLGVFIIIMGVVIASIPHGIAILFKQMEDGLDIEKMNDESYILSLFEPNLNLFFLLLPFVGGLMFLFIVVKFLHKQTIKYLTTARPKIDWKRFWFIFFIWSIISSGFILLEYFLAPDGYVFNFKPIPFLILCLIAVVLIPIQTSFEEYMFRGYLMQGIGVLVKNRWFPLLTTSLMFGLLHIANPEVEKLGYIIMIYYIGTGLFLGVITLMDEGLELALGFHAANNLFTALLVTADWTAFQTHSVFKDISNPTETSLVDIIAPVFVIFPLLLVILSKKYRWTNWSEKLFGRVEEPPKEDEISKNFDTQI